MKLKLKIMIVSIQKKKKTNQQTTRVIELVTHLSLVLGFLNFIQLKCIMCQTC